MSFIQNFFTSRDNNANAETFVGQEGRLWFDPVTNQIYSSDGNTPGGIPLAGGGGNVSPGGSNSQVQFNNNGSFGGTANLTINSATGALTAGSFVGDGSALTGITGANVTGTVASATAATTAGTVTTNAQPNITSVGTLTGVTVTGDVTGGNLVTSGTGNIGTLVAGATTNNYAQLTGGATTKAVEFKTLGSDTNVGLAIRSQGTGAIDLAAGSRGVNISNGGTVTAITGTATGAYTVVPTFTISAPTTAGGVQATGTVGMQLLSGATIANAGTGYAIGDTITLSGGTGTAAVLVVATRSGSGVATFTNTNAGTYTAIPTSPIATTTSGSGTGFALTGLWGVRGTAYTITNAGSGYVEQPTITFSSGSATAYAVVGTTTVVKGLANTVQFATSMGSALDLTNYGSNQTTNRYALFASATGNPAIIEPRGDTNVNAVLSSRGASPVQFYTNGFSGGGSGLLQLNVAHTASAVNYVQVTGAATGGAPTISAQGSDANVALVITSKGTLPLYLNTAGISDVRIQPNGIRTFSFSSVTSAVNYGLFTSAVAGFSPALSVLGTDTNIDLTLTPKGTGLVRFGTYTAGAPQATGYISIKAADGTTYKVLVGT